MTRHHLRSEHAPARKNCVCCCICECYYLYKEDNEKIEVGYPSELLKQILGDKIPNCVLKEKENNNIRTKTKKRLFKQGICGFQKDIFETLLNPHEC